MDIYISCLKRKVKCDTIEDETALIKELEGLSESQYAHLNTEFNENRGYHIWDTEIRDAYWRRRRKAQKESDDRNS